MSANDKNAGGNKKNVLDNRSARWPDEDRKCRGGAPGKPDGEGNIKRGDPDFASKRNQLVRQSNLG